jgi:hypothetical protein
VKLLWCVILVATFQTLVAGCVATVDPFGRKLRTFVMTQGRPAELKGASTVGVWASDSADRTTIVREIRRRLPAVAVIEGDACARADVQYFVQDQNQARGGSGLSSVRFVLDAHVHAQGYSCDTTTALTWYDQANSGQKMAKRFAAAFCQLLLRPL